MGNLPHPAEGIAAIACQLYRLADHEKIPMPQRQAVLLHAHKLRGNLITVVPMQFAEGAAAHQDVTHHVESALSSINLAERDISKVHGVITATGALSDAIDRLVIDTNSHGANLSGPDDTNSTGAKLRGPIQ